MQAAHPRGRAKSPQAGSVPAGENASELDRLLSASRQEYLDALPIAAAILSQDPSGARIDCANELFRQVVKWDERLGDRRISPIPFLSAGELGNRLPEFLSGSEPAHQFDCSDGRSVGGHHFTIRFARLRSLQGGGPRCLVSLIDKTAQVETEKNLRSEMLRDSLTGLPNRTAFTERVEAVLEDPNFKDGSYAVLVADMTLFSRVNESMGAIAGDELLIAFARRLFSALRPSDVLARIEGDEFGILLKLDRGPRDALRAAERIKAVLTLPFRLSELEIRVDCAIGCAILTRGVDVAEEVLRNAQFALKRAKRLGLTQLYEPSEAQAVRRRFSIETELRRAIENEELKLCYQPLIDLRNGSLAGFEALARWDHEDEGPISPSEFIPVAEESGLIVQLGRWALERATIALAGWDRRAGHVLPLSVAVNLSPIQIARDEVPALVSRALAQSGLAGERLTLELTESAIIHDPDGVGRVLQALKKSQVRIAMDDFGTGYTSLAYLQRLPIDILKIDRTLIAGMIGDSDATAVVRAILSLANALGIDTTAEGVETAELAHALKRLGCSHGQGFHFADALDEEAAFAYLSSRSA
jgi:diguanylate cyclase (GGDEF)-like protein